MAEACSQIIEHQRAWARGHHIAVDEQGYTSSIDENLYRPLSPEARSELMAGSGNELGGAGIRGKMQALHSSSALAYNVFEYWRHLKVTTIAHLCGSAVDMSTLRLEQQFPTGLRGTPPNLDVAFFGKTGHVLAIESKFTEPFTHGLKNTFQASYFRRTPGYWIASGLDRCELLAQKIYRQEAVYKHLDAAQLLKHILGLAHQVGQNFTLCYLWYDVAGSEGQAHRQEIAEFSNEINGEVAFRALTYRELIEAICDTEEADRSYTSYIKDRYLMSMPPNVC